MRRQLFSLFYSIYLSSCSRLRKSSELERYHVDSGFRRFPLCRLCRLSEYEKKIVALSHNLLCVIGSYFLSYLIYGVGRSLPV